MSKIAILQVADQGPLESLVLMLKAVGYECRIPDDGLLMELRSTFGRRGLVLSPKDLHRSMGYDMPEPLQMASIADMKRAALYVDVKAHQIHDDVVLKWPNLFGKVLWYRIQGGKPEHVIKQDGTDCGDEVNPPCPVLTPNLWYKSSTDKEGCLAVGNWSLNPATAVRAYACWPPFRRFNEYRRRPRLTIDEFLAAEHVKTVGSVATMRPTINYAPPVCLIHNLHGWGYGAIVDGIRALGVKCYGAGSPDGLVNHYDIPNLLSNALCMVHLKSSDAPGYSLLESLSAACPVICTRRLIWRCKMESLFIPDKTCLVFDRETHDGLTPADVESCLAEVAEHLERLRDPVENRRIGEAGRVRLREVMWSKDNPADVDSLKEFFARNFP